jgi:hypothetical protein
MARQLIVGVFIFLLTDFSLEVADKVCGDQYDADYLRLVWNALIYLGIMASLIINYLVVCRYPEYTQYFSAIQSLVLMVGVLENKFMDYGTEDMININISILVLVQSLTYVGYC